MKFKTALVLVVLSLLLNVDDSTDIKPLKAQYEFERDYTPYYYWGGGLLLVLLIVGYLIWRRLKRAEEEIEFVDNRSAWEIAFEKLALLNQKPYVTEKKFREYYFELTEIYKAYCDKIFNKNYLDMTTEEFLVSYRDENINESIFKAVGRALDQAASIDVRIKDIHSSKGAL